MKDAWTLEREFTVASELGLHARPAGQFVQLAGRFSAEITVSADGDWVSARSVPNHVELAWETPQTINAARILNGYTQGGRLTWQIHDFVLQMHDGREWRDIPGTKTTGNRKGDWHARFAPVTTKRLRLLVTAGEYEQTVAPYVPPGPKAAETQAYYDEFRMIDQATALVARLTALARPNLTAEFRLFPGEGHMSLVPTAASHTLRFVTAG